jgi:DNA-binding PadR family transcriptional regulator
MQTIQRDILRGHLESLVLAVLERGPAHGLDVIRRVATAGDGSLKLKEGTLYPALYRMEANGLVEAEWEDSASGRRGPRRRIYRLTTKGKRQLARGREEFVQFVQVIGGILGATP